MKKLLLLLAFAPVVCFAHVPADLGHMAMLYVDNLLSVREKVCQARAPSEAKRLSQSLSGWRKENQVLLRQLEETAEDFERAASEMAKGSQSRETSHAGYAFLHLISAAKVFGPGMELDAFAKSTDAHAKAMCASHALSFSEATFLRQDLESALKTAEKLKKAELGRSR